MGNWLQDLLGYGAQNNNPSLGYSPDQAEIGAGFNFDYENNMQFPGEGGAGLGSLQGFGSLLGGLGSLGQAYMGYQNLGLAEDQLDFNKSSFYDNYAAQANTINERMNNLAIGRHAKNPGLYATPADQMSKYGVDPAATKDKKRQKQQVT